MQVTIEQKARPCPGVERAISIAEDVLSKDKKLISVGQLIHNRREVERLQKLGMQIIKTEFVKKCQSDCADGNVDFLVRAHGEKNEIIEQAHECGLRIVDATCSIVRHSQELIENHVRDGWCIIIVGNKHHPEVDGLMSRAKGNGIVISNIAELKNQDFEERSLLIAQTTVNPELFSKVCHQLSKRLSTLKIADTTCRFLRTRQKDLSVFSQEQDMVIIIGGKNSANCRLLFEKSQSVNEKSYHVEGPEDLQSEWFQNNVKIGISGGASTPKWQLEEMKKHIQNNGLDKNPKGLKNRKGGKFLWWNRKKTN